MNRPRVRTLAVQWTVSADMPGRGCVEMGTILRRGRQYIIVPARGNAGNTVPLGRTFYTRTGAARALMRGWLVAP